ncbi:sister-chromatid cohesion protein 3 [Carica papaya]|uniref:sister-chromatid cohesion protein 3 n=1 Tax=Carica papaya TaxID=3649 RepID=UPI000B8D09B4|nr:sister-chromatid cohesion protein 3 [Carica papaya]
MSLPAKRGREDVQIGGGGNDDNGSGAEFHKRTSTEDGPTEVEREASPDDFEDSRPKRSRTTGGTSSEPALSLIEVVRGNGKIIPQAVKLWVERYERNPKPAMVDLLMMLFEACGPKYYVSEDFVDMIDVDDVVVALVNLARRGEVEESTKKKEIKNFRGNLVSFWDNLVIECQNGPLFDTVLFEKCMDYIIALSCTPPRVYRQVASLMGLQLVTSFISVAKMLGSQRETTQRQLNTEMKKRSDGPRVESLNKRLSMTHDKITALEDMMRKIFTGLFVHRYRDIDPNIRMSCIQSLGSWILSWEYMKAMKDWKCIISMLLDENPLIELTDEDATNLIRLLSASVVKAVGETIIPASDNRKPYFTKAQKEIFESNRREITVSMMKYHTQLLRKFMADKAKVSSLVEIIVYMNLELYSLKRQEQNFKTVLQLIKDAFFKHGEKEALRSCVKAITFCATESQGELQDFSRNKMKDLEDELIAKLRSAMKEVADGNDEYSLLVNLKRLYELQLSKPVHVGSLYDDIAMTLRNLRNLDDEVVSFMLLNMYLYVAWSLHSVVNSEVVSEASLRSLLSKRTTLFEELEYYLNIPPLVEGSKSGNQLACRVCTMLAEVCCLFRKTNFASTRMEMLGYCPDTSVLEKFWKLCEQQLSISDETEDDDANKEYIEETNRDAVMIAAAKLVTTDTVPKDYLGPEVISQFVMHGANVAEIVKKLISVLRKRDDDLSNIFLEALKRAFSRYAVKLSTDYDESVRSRYFQECKNLAARLSGTFMGAARNKYRSEILTIVREGIDYAFIEAPRQLSFLEGAILHFVSKLPSSDVMDILKDVQKRRENFNTDEDPSGWRPYFTFVDTLSSKYAMNDDFQDEKDGATVRRRGRPRKSRNIEGKRLFDENNSSEEEPISDPDQEDAQDEEDDENAPLIHSLKSSRLRSSKTPREENTH